MTADTGKKDDNGKPIVKVKEHVVTDKHYPPSLGAIIHFQTNRDPDNWKNRQENKVSGKVGIRAAWKACPMKNFKRLLMEIQTDGNIDS